MFDIDWTLAFSESGEMFVELLLPIETVFSAHQCLKQYFATVIKKELDKNAQFPNLLILIS